MRLAMIAAASGLFALVGSTGAEAASEYIFGFSPYGTQQLIINGTTTINAYSTGWYDNTGFHSSGNSNYIAGYVDRGGSSSAYYNDYFAFDLSSVSGPITSAVLSIGNGPAGYTGPASGARFTDYDVSTSITDLTASQTGATGIYADLGSGVSYGSTLVDFSSNSMQVNITLNGAALAAIQAASGSNFAIGGSLNLSSVPLPASAPMFGAALVALGMVGYGLRRRSAA